MPHEIDDERLVKKQEDCIVSSWLILKRIQKAHKS
jgi:hypothetical protein